MVEDEDDYQKVFEYFPEGDEWSLLPDHSHAGFALGQFQGQLTTVGGVSEEGERNGRVHRYKKESRQWTEFLKPLINSKSFSIHHHDPVSYHRLWRNNKGRKQRASDVCYC